MNVYGNWRNIVKFHEIGFENGGDRCIMDEGIRMRVSSPFICHVLCPVVSCFWVLEVGPVDDENCSPHVSFLFWHFVQSVKGTQILELFSPPCEWGIPFEESP